MAELITPVYGMRDINETIRFGPTNIEIATGSNQVVRKGEPILQFVPDLRLAVDVDLSADIDLVLELFSSGKNATLSIPGAEPLKAICTGTKYFVPERQAFRVRNQSRKRLKSVIFHVINFSNFVSRPPARDILHEDHRGGGERLGRAILEDSEMTVELQAIPSVRTIMQQLQAFGGYGMTHVGRIQRRSGQTFSISTARAYLREITMFLSFARGLWTPLILPVGLDAQGNRVYEE